MRRFREWLWWESPVFLLVSMLLGVPIGLVAFAFIMIY